MMSRFFADAATIMPSLMLILFMVFFCGVLIWLFHPRNKKKFEEYGKIPFKEDPDGGEK